MNKKIMKNDSDKEQAGYKSDMTKNQEITEKTSDETEATDKVTEKPSDEEVLQPTNW